MTSDEGSITWRTLAAGTWLAVCLSSGVACDDDAPAADAPAAAAQPSSPTPATKAPADGKPAPAPPASTAKAPTDTKGPACDIGPLSAEPCPFSLAQYQTILGIEGDLELKPDPTKGKCELWMGDDVIVTSEVREVDAKASAKEAEGLDDLLSVRQAAAVDLGVPNCPAVYRGSLYDHLIVVGQSHVATFVVRYPKGQAARMSGDERKQLNEQRGEVAEKIARALGQRLQ